jgi:hypothetical protein
MRFQFIAGLIAPLLIAFPATAQSPVWQSPAKGYLYDQVTRTIRTMVGIPGSAYAGPAVQSNVEWASLSPGGRSSLLVRGGHLAWFPDLNADAAALDFADVPDACVWSADSTRAVALSQKAGSVSWLSGFRSVPQVEARWDLASIGAAEWKLLAADSKAESVLLAARGDSGWTIWLAISTSAPASVGTVLRPSAATFDAGSSAAYVADAGARVVYALQSQALQPVFTADDGIGEPAGLLAAGNGRLAIADGTSQTLRVFDLSTRAAVQQIELFDEPGAVLPYGDNRFLVNRRQRADQPFRFLDTFSDWKVVFVPAGDLQ